MSGYEYSDVNVTISQTGSIARSGSGSVTLSGTATWKYRAIYSDGTTGEWQNGSGTPDIYQKMNGPLNLNGVTVTAPGENTQVEQANASDFRAGISLGGTTYYSSTTNVSQPGYNLSTINITIAGPNEFGYEGEMIFSADKSFPGTVTLGVVYENSGTGSESLVTFTYSQVSGNYGSNYKIDWKTTDGSTGPYATISRVYVKKVVVNGAVYNDTPIYYVGDICYMLNMAAPEDEGSE